MLGKFIAGDFIAILIAIAGEMCRFPASNDNTDITPPHYFGISVSMVMPF